MNSIYEGLNFILIVILFSILVFILLSKTIKYIDKKHNKNIVSFFEKHCVLLSFLSLLVSIFLSLYSFGMFGYLYNQTKDSTIFEKYYVDPKNVEITFPKEKQNLIYIFVESLENTVLGKENGGGEDISYAPNLESLAINNTNFSNKENIGGALQVYGSSYTVAAMVSHTSGVPFKLSINKNSYNGKNEFLPGVYSIGEILQENGYKNYLMIGSDALFGGRKDYFTINGNYTIYDYNYAKQEGLIKEDYKKWWGYEDSKLYKFAKDKLLEVSKNNEPFNFTILTADTHFVDGYVDDSCKSSFENKYANSFNCTDKMLYEFITWIKEQSFYENTTIVIVGDHFTMQENFYDNINKNYVRTLYNTIINSRTKPTNNINREYSSFDYFPTTLAALGCTIKGNRLGLGTNLYSDDETLIELMSYEKFNEELKKNSNFYNKNILREK